MPYDWLQRYFGGPPEEPKNDQRLTHGPGKRKRKPRKKGRR